MPVKDKSKARKSTITDKSPGLSFYEQLDDVQFDDWNFNSKTKVDCICPRCGERHVLAFHWIGRGTPRKYCQACKGSSD